MQLVIESSGFLDVEDAFLCQQTDATDASVESDSDAAEIVVGFGRDDGSAIRSVNRIFLNARSAFGSQINANIRILLGENNKFLIKL